MDENVLISASEDQTIFIYTISQSSNGTLLTPVGFIPFSVQLIEFDENKVKMKTKLNCDEFIVEFFSIHSS